MHKVVTINLNGRAFQLDDDAYELMRAYLERAEGQLRDNPDRAEIMGDLEQAIAEKCERYLGAQKTVLTSGEVKQILDEMGPVEAGAPDPQTGAGAAPGDPKPSAATPPADPTKRLYRIKEGALIGGVCNGLAAYFALDVTLLRVGFVVIALIDLALIHTPIAVLAYIAMMLLLPEASTGEEQAEARGIPFNATEVVNRAKKLHAELRNENWRHKKREWRRQRREWKRQWRGQGEPWAWTPAPMAPPTYGSRLAAGMTMPILTAINAVIFWGGLFAILSLLRKGDVYGMRMPEGVPIWIGVIIVFVLMQAIGAPLEAARRAGYQTLGGANAGWFAAWDGLLAVGFGILVLWFGYNHMPEIRDALTHLPDIWHNFIDSFRRP